jgi:uncharacterized membrane protein YedE/YeeE
MRELVFVTPWPWWLAGLALGLVAVLVAWIGGRALGVSTAYGSVCALRSGLAFFQTREYQERWRLWFVLGLPLGGLLGAVLGGGVDPRWAYGSMDALTGGSLALKLGLTGLGGVLVGAGARWAGGCPSGHSIVGIAQGAVSSLVATVGFMVAGAGVYQVLHRALGG